MNLFKRGQAATEYLIILAVVIIIAIIVIGVIGGFPGMTQGISERESASYWASAHIGLIRYTFSQDGENNMMLVRNNNPFMVTVEHIFVDGTDIVPQPYTIAPGTTQNFTFTSFNCSVEGTYSYTVRVVYSDPQYNTVYSFHGEKNLVGRCQPPNGTPGSATPTPTPGGATPTVSGATPTPTSAPAGCTAHANCASGVCWIGTCHYCGDGYCDPGETSVSCSQDCGGASVYVCTSDLTEGTCSSTTQTYSLPGTTGTITGEVVFDSGCSDCVMETYCLDSPGGSWVQGTSYGLHGYDPTNVIHVDGLTTGCTNNYGFRIVATTCTPTYSSFKTS